MNTKFNIGDHININLNGIITSYQIDIDGDCYTITMDEDAQYKPSTLFKNVIHLSSEQLNKMARINPYVPERNIVDPKKLSFENIQKATICCRNNRCEKCPFYELKTPSYCKMIIDSIDKRDKEHKEELANDGCDNNNHQNS